jgi:hypothetical protein
MVRLAYSLSPLAGVGWGEGQRHTPTWSEWLPLTLALSPFMERGNTLHYFHFAAKNWGISSEVGVKSRSLEKA